MKMLDFYRAVLTAGNLQADESGYVSAVLEGTAMPFTVDGDRLVLPTREHQANPDKKASKIVLFHPLQENILRAESAVMSRFRTVVNIRLNFTIGVLVGELLQLATSPGMHNRLKPDQLDLMGILKDADEKTMGVFESLLKVMKPGNVEQCFVHFYIKRNGVIHGKSHRRVSVVSFPFYEELLRDTKQAYGVKLRKKDHEMLVKVMQHLLPNLDKEGFYNRGSISDTSPTLEALLLGVLGVVDNINTIVDQFEGILPEVGTLRYSDEWVEPLNNVDQFAAEVRMIPMQAGNEGAVDARPGQAPAAQLQNVAAPVAHAPAPTAAYPTQPAPQAHAGGPIQYHIPTPAAPPADGPVVGSGGLDYAASMARRHPQQPQYGIQPGGYGGPGYGYQPQVSPQNALRDPRNIPAYERMGSMAQPQQPQYGYGQQPMAYGQPGGYRI